MTEGIWYPLSTIDNAKEIVIFQTSAFVCHIRLECSHNNFPHSEDVSHKILNDLSRAIGLELLNESNSFSETNMCVTCLQMEACRADNVFATP